MNLSLLTNTLLEQYPVIPQPVEDHPQNAAVLVILYPVGTQVNVLLIKRAAHLRSHAGEISFPGGMYETEDHSLLTTSLRETREEVHIEIAESQVIACLPQVMTLTGFQVTPYLALLEGRPPYEKNPEEVEAVLDVPLVPLLATHHRDVGYPPAKNMVAYWYQQNRVWGATAKILHHIGQAVRLL
ncbi:MAG: CoA pyrophosphatase [Nitrospina sp.]|nr:MAG: CoA pyrophosphatase [Nitrospina sp.]